MRKSSIHSCCVCEQELDQGHVMKPISLQEAIDRDIGKRGTPEREEFEAEIKLEMLGEEIKKIRNEKQLTQSDLGKKIGVTKYQISRIEADTTRANIQTIIKVFNALGKELSFNVIG